MKLSFAQLGALVPAVMVHAAVGGIIIVHTPTEGESTVWPPMPMTNTPGDPGDSINGAITYEVKPEYYKYGQQVHMDLVGTKLLEVPSPPRRVSLAHSVLRTTTTFLRFAATFSLLTPGQMDDPATGTYVTPMETAGHVASCFSYEPPSK